MEQAKAASKGPTTHAAERGILHTTGLMLQATLQLVTRRTGRVSARSIPDALGKDVLAVCEPPFMGVNLSAEELAGIPGVPCLMELEEDLVSHFSHDFDLPLFM